MRKSLLASIALGICVLQSDLAAAEEKRTFTKEQIRAGCNAQGGTLLGISEYGSYGCEFEKTGNMILCNKKSECTIYTAAKTKPEVDRVTQMLGLQTRPGAKR
jgi:hypothetical protein